MLKYWNKFKSLAQTLGIITSIVVPVIAASWSVSATYKSKNDELANKVSKADIQPLYIKLDSIIVKQQLIDQKLLLSDQTNATEHKNMSESLKMLAKKTLNKNELIDFFTPLINLNYEKKKPTPYNTCNQSFAENSNTIK